jgi:guanylate kinase
MSLIALVGHSASGKSTIERLLVDMGYKRIISYTTRPMRKGEVHGEDYIFISDEEFDVLNGQNFFEETARYREWQYGLSLKGIDYINEDWIVVVTVHGLNELLKVVDSSHLKSIHIKVNERERMLRLINRGDSLDEAMRRINADREDFKDVEEVCDYIVENDKSAEALVEVYNIITKTK